MRTYTVDQQAMDYHPTLEQSDLGKMYIVLQGSIIFVENQEQADELQEIIDGETPKWLK